MADSLRIAAIVEGHGEVPAVPILLRRIGYELFGGKHIEVATPIRHTRGQLVQSEIDTLDRAVTLATRKLQALPPQDSPTLILILIDADDDCPAKLGPELLKRAQLESLHSVSVVLAKFEFETWFVGSADSLADYLDLSGVVPLAPEESGSAKKWIADRFKAGRYSETVDQPKLTNAIDLAQCRARCPSFDKLCRDIENAFDAPSLPT